MSSSFILFIEAKKYFIRKLFPVLCITNMYSDSNPSLYEILSIKDESFTTVVVAYLTPISIKNSIKPVNTILNNDTMCLFLHPLSTTCKSVYTPLLVRSRKLLVL